jgi:hypothetical protein
MISTIALPMRLFDEFWMYMRSPQRLSTREE